MCWTPQYPKQTEGIQWTLDLIYTASRTNRI